MLVRTTSGDHAYCTWFRDTTAHSGTFLVANLVNLNSAQRQRNELPAPPAADGDATLP